MDATRFDAMAKALGSGATRRRVLGGLLGGGLTGLVGRRAAADHKPEHTKDDKKPKKDKGGGAQTCRTCAEFPSLCLSSGSPDCMCVVNASPGGSDMCALALPGCGGQVCQSGADCPGGFCAVFAGCEVDRQCVQCC